MLAPLFWVRRVDGAAGRHLLPPVHAQEVCASPASWHLVPLLPDAATAVSRFLGGGTMSRGGAASQAVLSGFCFTESPSD